MGDADLRAWRGRGDLGLWDRRGRICHSDRSMDQRIWPNFAEDTIGSAADRETEADRCWVVAELVRRGAVRFRGSVRRALNHWGMTSDFNKSVTAPNDRRAEPSEINPALGADLARNP